MWVAVMATHIVIPLRIMTTVSYQINLVVSLLLLITQSGALTWLFFNKKLSYSFKIPLTIPLLINFFAVVILSAYYLRIMDSSGGVDATLGLYYARPGILLLLTSSFVFIFVTIQYAVAISKFSDFLKDIERLNISGDGDGR
jgi:hypothetical protein